MASLLLGVEDRAHLADFLNDRIPPSGFNSDLFACFQYGELATITFEELSALCNYYGAEKVLDAIRWPKKQTERRFSQPILGM